MKLCDLLRPLMLACPRPSMAILGLLGAGYGDDPRWKSVQPRYRSYFDRRLQCIMSADLAEWGGRSCYYWGRYSDFAHQSVLRRFLAPGDTYIDIGANIGYHSLFAARIAGTKGLVLSFEPNPATYAVLSAHVAINRLSQCRTYKIALSDTDGEAVLNQLEEHSGTSTFVLPAKAPLRSVAVPTKRGDDFLRNIPFSGNAVLKIDVEGFEQRVLNGLRETLERISVAAVEVTPEWLAKLGGSAEEVYRFMREAGFRPLIPEVNWRFGLLGPELKLVETGQPLRTQHDVIFVR